MLAILRIYFMRIEKRTSSECLQQPFIAENPFISRHLESFIVEILLAQVTFNRIMDVESVDG